MPTQKIRVGILVSYVCCADVLKSQRLCQFGHMARSPLRGNTPLIMGRPP